MTGKLYRTFGIVVAASIFIWAVVTHNYVALLIFALLLLLKFVTKHRDTTHSLLIPILSLSFYYNCSNEILQKLILGFTIGYTIHIIVDCLPSVSKRKTDDEVEELRK